MRNATLSFDKLFWKLAVLHNFYFLIFYKPGQYKNFLEEWKHVYVREFMSINETHDKNT